MFFRRPIFGSLAINAFTLILFLLFGVVRYGALDDYFMATVLNGAYGSEFDPHLVFVNVLIAYLLYPLISLFSEVGWFYIFEMGSLFVSFTVFSFFLIRRLGFKTGLPFALLITSLSLEFYARVSFTQCAAALVAAGGISFICGCKERRSAFLGMGILFLFLGAALRLQMFLLSIPFLILAILLQPDLKKIICKKTLISLALCGVSLFAMQNFDRRFYVEPDYQYYKAYQWKRSLFGDGRHFDKEAIFDELEERGMQGQDFLMLCEWAFYDTEAFSTDSLNRIIQIVNRNAYPINKARVPAAIALAISNAFMLNTTWCWGLLGVYLLLFSEKRSRLYPWLSLLPVILGYSYLFSLNRLAGHVEMGMWLYAAIMAIPFMPRSDHPKIPKAVTLLAVGFIFLEVLALPHVKTVRHVVAVPEMSESWQLFLNYAEQHSDDAFLLSFDQYKALGMVKDPAYRAPAPGSWKNIFPIGYWNIHLPAMKRELNMRGVENPLRDIVNDNVFLLETGNIPAYRSFYEAHYHRTLQVDTVATFGELRLLKYREPEERYE